ncbi:hypothetical protein EX30DRAFT_388482 [Ascodesmis nigricans]|uniref:DUF7909 domain-containing protein n=1 Tax=Ascodesmis nigricans TaxID=341454 RepID=A0A4S2MZD3_9PEZI|nr:hypothetical protein EX30DRAFT_388482 [Ascodesmis nigricans]
MVSSFTTFAIGALLFLVSFTNASPLLHRRQDEECIRSKLEITDILTPFAIEIQVPSRPDLHLRRMNMHKAGGGDNHLYLSPNANPSHNNTLVGGVIHNFEPTFSSSTSPNGVVIRAVINGEYTARDNTTKLFMTQRGDPRAVFDVWHGCHSDTGVQQYELVMREGPELKRDGGNICVRPASGGRTEFRWSPKGNPLDNEGCTNVVLVPVWDD